MGPGCPLRHGPPQGAAQVKTCVYVTQPSWWLRTFPTAGGGSAQPRALQAPLSEPAPGLGGALQAPALTCPSRSGGTHLRENRAGQPEPPCLLRALTWNLNMAGMHRWGERNPSLRRCLQVSGWQRKPLNEAAPGQPRGPCPSPQSPFVSIATAVRGKAPLRQVTKTRQTTGRLAPWPGEPQGQPPGPLCRRRSAQQHARYAPLFLKTSRGSRSAIRRLAWSQLPWARGWLGVGSC